MHINSHFAIGMIFSSVVSYFLNLSVVEFIIIVIFSFICDFDVFFSKFAKNHNHRMLITHSIIPSAIMLIPGLILNWPLLYLSGVSYAIHIVIDTFDWGTNFFFFNKKQSGSMLLISKEELENLSEFTSKYKTRETFFDLKYYNNKYCITIEISLFILMIIFVSVFTLEYLWVSSFYFVGLYFHLSRHFYLKRLESSPSTE